jgi:hypothetical protein
LRGGDGRVRFDRDRQRTTLAALAATRMKLFNPQIQQIFADLKICGNLRNLRTSFSKSKIDQSENFSFRVLNSAQGVL